MSKKIYDESDLVSFGKYLLSEQRENNITGDKREVHHADIANWLDAPETAVTEFDFYKRHYLRTLRKEDATP